MKTKPKLTRKQQIFVDELIKNPKQSATKAAQAAYNVTTPHSAEVVAHENLRKPEIMAWLSNHAVKAEQALTRVLAYSADKGQESAAYAGVAVSAANSVLDRVHGKATQRVEVQSTALVLSIDMSGATPEPNTLDTNEGEQA